MSVLTIEISVTDAIAINTYLYNTKIECYSKDITPPQGLESLIFKLQDKIKDKIQEPKGKKDRIILEKVKGDCNSCYFTKTILQDDECSNIVKECFDCKLNETWHVIVEEPKDPIV